ATGLPLGLAINSSSGVISGMLPSNSAGVYSVTATVHDGSVAASVTFTWTVAGTSVSGLPSSMVTGGTLVASWANISNPAPTYWFGLFPRGARDGAYVPWMSPTGTATGSKALQLPASLPAASYELRLFAHNTLQRLAVSSPLLVASPTLTASPSTVL